MGDTNGVSPVCTRPGYAARDLGLAGERELGGCWFSLCRLLLLALHLEKAEVFLAAVQWELFCVGDGGGNNACVLSYDREGKTCQ